MVTQGEGTQRPRRFVGRRTAEALQRQQQEAQDGSKELNPNSKPSSPADSPAQEACIALTPRVPAPAAKRFVKQQVPDDIINDEALNAAIAALPANYNFEVHKTVARIRTLGATRVALQFPEGLLMYACVIADILEGHAGVQHAFVLGDVTYGACCVDDFSAEALGAQLLVHYGHSCLVPVDITRIPCMYVFVDIAVDVRHLVATVRGNFRAGASIALAGTIQFGSSIQEAKRQLALDFPSLGVPQRRPLSSGEVLGCTAPSVAPDTEAIVFVADGRFHLEAIMIANPALPAYRYDPYAREMTQEMYDQVGMREARRAAVQAAAPAREWGVVLGTLGRQGNPRLVEYLEGVLKRHNRSVLTVLLSEVLPTKLAMFEGIQAWVQVACPRLSIDWGEAFTTPTLTPYEALVALGEVPPWWEQPPRQQPHHQEIRPRKSHLLQPLTQPQQQQAWGEQQPQQQQHHTGLSDSELQQTCCLQDTKLTSLPSLVSCIKGSTAPGRVSSNSESPNPELKSPSSCAANVDAADVEHQLGDVILSDRRSNTLSDSSPATAPLCEGTASSQQQAREQHQNEHGNQQQQQQQAREVDSDSQQLPQQQHQQAISHDEDEQQQARAHQFDPYPMDYYARDGGQWSSYYPQVGGTGGAAKLAALRAARAPQRA